ncbi:hypothetical protein [Pseudomonas sp. FG-3G]|nr:hypothetical protein [Pseudomonas sp. FG-3G]
MRKKSPKQHLFARRALNRRHWAVLFNTASGVQFTLNATSRT